MSGDAETPQRWAARPLQAWIVRGAAFLAPLVASFAFVRFASVWIGPPHSSLWLFLLWWFGLSGAATVVLVGVERVSRRLLPLSALLKLSLAFPDETPSRFKTALRSGGVDSLKKRLSLLDEAKAARTPRDSAALLLELVAALSAHDRLTRGHSERVRAYSVLIGKQLGLPKHDLELLNWAALLHDIGKLEVGQGILTKPERPSDEEWQILRQHPVFGEQLAAPLAAWLDRWQAAIGYHHERWDGTGYPRGLRGADIPIAGRIVAVADSYDVITSARSYKQAGNSVRGREEIARCAGTQFDPSVVRAFLNVSLGRMRMIMGPLSWLSHAPILARLPLTPAIGTLAGTVGVLATAAVSGAIAHPLITPTVSPEVVVAAAAAPHASPGPAAPRLHLSDRPIAGQISIAAAPPHRPPPPSSSPTPLARVTNLAGRPTAHPRPPAPTLEAASTVVAGTTTVTTAGSTAPAPPTSTTPVAPPLTSSAPAPAPPPALTTAAPPPAHAAPSASTTPHTPPSTPPPPPATEPLPTTTTPTTPAPVAAAAPAVGDQLAFTSEPADGGAVEAGAATSFAVSVETADGAVVTSDDTTQVVLSLANSPGGTTLTCTNPGGSGPVTVAAGVATFSCSLDRTGAAYELAASDPGSGDGHPFAGTTSQPFSVIPGAAARLAFTAEPVTTTAGASITPAVQVAVEDADGNTVTTDDTTTVTLAIGTNPGAGTLSGTLTQTVSDGVATFADLSINAAAAGYTLTATSNPAHPATQSTTFTITAPPSVGASLLTSNSSSPCTSGASCSTASITPTAGATLLILVQRGGSTSAADAVTSVTGPLTGAASAASLEYPSGSGRNYLFAWTATASASSGAVTVDFAAGTNANPTIVDVVELSANDTTAPVAQAPTASGSSLLLGGAAADLSSPSPTSGEIILASFLDDQTASTPTGFTALDDVATGSNGGEDFAVFFASTAQAATTVALPGLVLATDWGTIALELNAA